MSGAPSLLQDALVAALGDSRSTWRWHVLTAAWLESRDAGARQSVLATLAAMPDGDPHSDILRLSFLARASGRPEFENAAAAKVLALVPADPDRLAAFMAFHWLSALQHAGSREAFTAALVAGRVPEMARLLHGMARDTIRHDLARRLPGEIRRVAVVAPYIGGRHHTPSMMAVEQCAVLAREGCQVHIFSAQELVPSGALFFRGDARELTLPPLDPQGWRSILPAGVTMTISDNRFSLPGRWRTLAPAMRSFDPDAVLLVGLFSPLAAALHEIRPVAAISTNSVAPISPLDVWLAADPADDGERLRCATFPPARTVIHPYRIKRSARNWPTTRNDLGLDHEAVVWVTAGFRLEHEIDGDWAARALQLLSREPGAVWLLVGGEGRLPPALQQAPAGRVRALRTRDDLPAIFRCADIYVNPPRMGGGFSVAEAMAEGLPVTSFAGSDGGDKVGALALTGIDAYMDCLATLTQDAGQRKTMGEALRRRFAERFDLEASGPSLMAALREAATAARERLTASS